MCLFFYKKEDGLGLEHWIYQLRQRRFQSDFENIESVDTLMKGEQINLLDVIE